MDHESIQRFRDSSVAAALNAMTPASEQESPSPEDLLPLMTADDAIMWSSLPNAVEPERQVFDACRELALVGLRPRSRSVMAFLADRHGTSPPRDQVSPLIKKWKAAQWKSEAVRTAFQAYAALDAEQRVAFRMRADVDDGMLSFVAMNESTEAVPFEIRIHYGGSRVMTHRADRATIAWIKFQNLIDRRHPDAMRIELVELASNGPRLLMHWTAAPANISTSF